MPAIRELIIQLYKEEGTWQKVADLLNPECDNPHSKAYWYKVGVGAFLPPLQERNVIRGYNNLPPEPPEPSEIIEGALSNVDTRRIEEIKIRLAKEPNPTHTPIVTLVTTRKFARSSEKGINTTVRGKTVNLERLRAALQEAATEMEKLW